MVGHQPIKPHSSGQAVRQGVVMGLVFQRRRMGPRKISGSYRPFDDIIEIG